jgi:hypothetical protein
MLRSKYKSYEIVNPKKNYHFSGLKVILPSVRRRFLSVESKSLEILKGDQYAIQIEKTHIFGSN